MFFKILKIPTDFLNTSSATWNYNPSYLKGRQIAKHLKVCNDLAERAIKLTQDYCHQTNREDKLQEIVQVVEESRSKYQSYINHPQKNIMLLRTMNSLMYVLSF